MKPCSICNKLKDDSEYYFYKTSRFTYCKLCAQKKTQQWKRDNPEKSSFYIIKRKYNLTKEEYEQLLARSGKRCQICGKKASLHIDHDHATGRIRGMLCVNCNHGLGKFYDDSDLLRAAINYLRD